MVAISVYLAAVAVVLTLVYLKYCFRVRREGDPPCVPGHILWGNGADFAEHAVRFLQRSQKALGDIFTIRLLHQHMTIIMDPHCYEQFAKEKNFDFEPIQEQVNMNVFGFKLKNARKVISEAGKKVNGKYLNSGFENYAKNLRRAFSQILHQQEQDQQQEEKKKEELHHNDSRHPTPGSACHDHPGTTQGSHPYSPLEEEEKSSPQLAQEGLRNLMARTIFDALFYTIFGRTDETREIGGFTPSSFHANFDIFHKFFNFLWLGMPVALFPRASQALKVLCQQPEGRDMIQREGVSEYIKLAIGMMLEQGQSQEDIIGHNLVFLHVNYNTFRVSYWCVYHLLDKPLVRRALERELQEAILKKRQEGRNAARRGAREDVEEVEEDGEVSFSIEDIDRLALLDSFLKETLRMASGVFMVRKVMDDTPFTMPDGQTYTVRKGDKVALYPPVFHMDPEIFEDPQT